jgi:hypothetical protein
MTEQPIVTDFAFLAVLEAMVNELEKDARRALDLLVDQEMAFSRQPHMNDSCNDIYELGLTKDDDKFCRRKRGHGGECAFGWREHRVYWKGRNYA